MADESDQPGRRLRLFLHGLASDGRFLDQRRILLRRAVHLDDRMVDLLDAGRLLGAGMTMSAMMRLTVRKLSTTAAIFTPASATRTVRPDNSSTPRAIAADALAPG